ncbi:MAG: bifunctional 23S rRNA (guanine(2069)-N(7))-methyltransferase RlmK/23S rRNA (guanine(2445)-N(2))-methyltransferase RlmL [Coriobacteriaceae bacterium]|jgi:23S rRNA (guanine2445-N2)-methyltransferase / 23S rRNA (guanine2069-N7)-methyltransferase|nr:bifunctional 23S rRNA (guanine(2069)-N(7))-methyltransferase RlmK/23S rRNA (guanine(2445)-N(2))-methyltransferase RlmL [Coriobacteriaceae bacterium]
MRVHDEASLPPQRPAAPRYEYLVRCAGGFEQILAQELKDLRIRGIRPLTGGVAFSGSLEEGYRACLWSRVASRVLLVIARIDATDADSLYRGVAGLDWTRHIAPGATMAVYAQGTNDALRNSSFTAQRAKDAICDRLRSARGCRPDVSPKRPDVPIALALRQGRATLSIDLSGEPLHRRGYREPGVQGSAPLKESLAAAILLESGFGTQEGAMFIDPLCGSGTLALEAAMIAAGKAPGLMRDYWGFTGWAGHDEALWDSLLAEARARLTTGPVPLPRIVAADQDPACVRLARDNVRRAGLEGHIECVQARVAGLSSLLGDAVGNGGSGSEGQGSPFAQGALPVTGGGLLATNPPYGQRLGTPSGLRALYAELAEGLKALPPGWQVSIISPDEAIDTALGMVPFAQKAFYNGSIETRLRRYLISHDQPGELEVATRDGKPITVRVSERNSSQFADRLRKVAKERAKWAGREGVRSYRVFDADLPDYAVAIDLYGGAGRFEGQAFLSIAEYQAPATVDAQRALRRFNDVAALAPAIMGIPHEHVFLRKRRHDKGGGQYQDARATPYVALTEEAGLLFEVDLGGRLDTGLFLDHRLTRARIGRLAPGKRFLNLFAYTGTATVYAAAAGARSTTTVDLSQTYLAWCLRNMALNGLTAQDIVPGNGMQEPLRASPSAFPGNGQGKAPGRGALAQASVTDEGKHRFIRADVLTWVEQAVKRQEVYDLVFLDPPTFSNSKAMGTRSWSVERDHVALISQVSSLLAPGATLVFSCNARKFKLAEAELEKQGLSVCDVSLATIPDDFKRSPKIHRCFEISRA